MKNYYQVLEIARDANDRDIQRAFRFKSLQFHPGKHKGEGLVLAQKRFNDVAEAFEVLGNPRLRAIFDVHGADALQRGLPDQDGKLVGGWTFSKDPMDVYKSFFGTASPFANFFPGNETGQTADVLLASKDHAAAEEARQGLKRQPPTTVNLYCSLEELFAGCVKTVRVSRQRLVGSSAKTRKNGGEATRPEEVTLDLEVQAGWRSGTKLTFKGEGDEAPGMHRADLEFIVREKPHPRFVRRGNTLVYKARISLSQALCGCTLDVAHLDGRTLPIPSTQVVSPTSSLVVPGEGMPIPGKPEKRGRLLVEFDVVFPKKLSTANKDKMRALLPA